MSDQSNPPRRTCVAATHVSKTYPSEDQPRMRAAALSDVNFTIGEAEFVSIIGPSGCGKSTLFNILAGLSLPDTGYVAVRGDDATGTTDHFAYMPQKDALFPWRRIIDNTALGLEVQGVSRRKARAAAAEYFATFGLAGFERAWPRQLSGGMRQRAALLRTVVQGRDALLLDEPFGALDSLTRTDMQEWLLEVWQQYRWTVVLITHDIREAVLLSDRVLTMSPRPGTISAETTIDLPRPRTTQIFADPRAIALESHLLKTLRAYENTAGQCGVVT